MAHDISSLSPAAVATALGERAEEFVRWLLPHGTRIGQDWCVGSVAGDPGNSCKICLEGDKVGRWADFAEGDLHGDLIDLLAAVRGVGIGPAMREACEWLGIERPTWAGGKPPKIVEPERPKNARVLTKAPLVTAWLAARKISEATSAKFKIIADGEDVVVFPSMRDGDLLHLKYRSVREKKFWSSAGTGKWLFGWQALNPKVRAVVLTEGEMDCLALAEYGLQALSIPFGAGKAGKQDWIENEWENLERFDTIFLAIDWDRAGQQTVQELVDRLGRTRCRVVRLPGKDANQCLMNGVPREEIIRAVTEAKTLDPDELRGAGEFAEQIIDRFHPKDRSQQGFLMPWLSMAEQFSFAWGATTIIAGYAGHGKSEITGQFVLDALRQGVRACVASLEFRSSKWLQRQVRQATGTPIPEVSAIQQTVEWLGNGLWVVDIYGTAKIDRLLDVFRYAHRRYGVRLFVIDNFSKLGIADDDLAGQKRAIDMITEFSVVHNVHTILVHHLRKEETDFSATNMSKLSLKGSGSISDMVDNIFLLWRHRTKEQKLKDPKFHELSDEDQAKLRRSLDALLRCEKYRDGDEEPRLALWFDRQSHLFVERQNEPPPKYMRIST